MCSPEVIVVIVINRNTRIKRETKRPQSKKKRARRDIFFPLLGGTPTTMVCVRACVFVYLYVCVCVSLPLSLYVVHLNVRASLV